MRWRTRYPAVVLFAITCLFVFAGGCGEQTDEGTCDLHPDWSAPSLRGADLVVAEVGGQPITASRLYHIIRQNKQMPQSGPSMAVQAREVLKDVISEECWSRLAKERGYDSDPEFIRALYTAQVFILRNVAQQREIERRALPDEEALRAKYEEIKNERFKIPMKIWARKIVVRTKKEAEEIRARIEQGEDFADLARQYSIDETTARRGGLVPPLVERDGHLEGGVPELNDVLVNLKKGEVSQVLRCEGGWCILQCTAKRESRMKSFEEVRDMLVEKYVEPKRKTLKREIYDSLVVAYDVVIYDDALLEFQLLQMSASEIMDMAKRGSSPEKRIKMYQHVVDHYPDSEYCPEAFFMIGFIKKEDMKDLQGAISIFETFVERYKGHRLAPDAHNLLYEARQELKASDSSGGEGK